jgi:hypothetical protein
MDNKIIILIVVLACVILYLMPWGVIAMVLYTDPNLIINNTSDPYREWIVTLAKVKKALSPWYWGTDMCLQHPCLSWLDDIVEPPQHKMTFADLLARIDALYTEIERLYDKSEDYNTHIHQMALIGGKSYTVFPLNNLTRLVGDVKIAAERLAANDLMPKGV